MTLRARSSTAILLSVSLLASGCARASKPPPPSAKQAQVSQSPGAASNATDTQVVVRRVIRRAELRLESDDLARSQVDASDLAERLGGFVLSTDARHDGESGSDDEHAATTMVLRIPSARFGEALERVRKMGTRVEDEKISGEDVTDQYVDLEARLKVERALEDRLLAILKDASTVKDELEVEKQVAEVRSEIERVEGRRRLLEDQASLATFTVIFSHTAAATSAMTFGLGDSIRHATSDSLGVFWAILRGAIRAAGVLAPIGLLVGVPAYVCVKLAGVLRRRRSLAR